MSKTVEQIKAEIAAAESAYAAAAETVEVTEARCAAWNAEIAKLSIKTAAIVAFIDRLGYGVEDIRRAKEINGSK